MKTDGCWLEPSYSTSSTGGTLTDPIATKETQPLVNPEISTDPDKCSLHSKLKVGARMPWSRLMLCAAMLFVGITPARVHAQDFQSLLAEAQAAQSRRDFRTAADYYRKAVEIDPSIPELWANLGLMEHETGSSAEAIESFKQAIRLKPSLFVPQFFLGLEYLSNQNPGGAIQFLENAKQLNPKDEQVELSLGRAESLLDHGDRAADSYYTQALQPTGSVGVLLMSPFRIGIVPGRRGSWRPS